MNKLIFPTALALSILCSCNSESDSKAQADKNEDVKPVENIEAIENGDSAAINDIEQEKKMIEPVEKTHYILSDKGINNFEIGTAIPFPSTSDNYKISKTIQTRMTEEGPSEETVYVVSVDDENMFEIKPQFDMTTGEYTDIISEIIASSSNVKTKDGIGAGSSIEEFIQTYPEHHFWYTYISGMYVLETDEIEAQFILDEQDFIGSMNIDSDMITLKKEDFKDGAKILKIRKF